MPPIRKGSIEKPIKTERAYIAASRRSDRSLDARIESARRASEIHEQRTGRALRVTKEDVLNEEMYEEIIPLPAGYRNSIARTPTQDPDFDRKFMAYLSSHLATRSALSQAVSSCWQGDYSSHNSPTAFINGSHSSTQFQQHSEQLPAAWDVNLRGDPTTQPPNKYRQTPYPLTIPSRPPTRHQQIASPASQGPDMNQCYFTSPCDSPIQAMTGDERRPSLANTTYRSSSCISSGSSPTLPRHLSSDNLSSQSSYATPDARYHHHGYPGVSRTTPGTIGFPAMPSSWQALTEPLSTKLPAGCEDLLSTNPWDFIPEMASPWPQNPQASTQRYGYSYNPNGRPKSSSHSPKDLTVGAGQ